MNRGIRCAATHSEIVGLDDHRPPVDLRPTEQHIGRQEGSQFALFVIGWRSAQLPDLAETALVDQTRDPFACIQLSFRLLLLEFLGAAHGLGKRAAPADFIDLLLPAHAGKNRCLPNLTAK